MEATSGSHSLSKPDPLFHHPVLPLPPPQMHLLVIGKVLWLTTHCCWPSASISSNSVVNVLSDTFTTLLAGSKHLLPVMWPLGWDLRSLASIELILLGEWRTCFISRAREVSKPCLINIVIALKSHHVVTLQVFVLLCALESVCLENI